MTTLRGGTGSAVVIGAGIGGLTAAVALHRIGWAVTVLEQAPVIAEVGAGLTLWPNAVRALGVLGLEEAVSAHAIPTVSRGNIRQRATRQESAPQSQHNRYARTTAVTPESAPFRA